MIPYITNGATSTPATTKKFCRMKGQFAFYRQIAQMDERYTKEIEPLFGKIQRPVLILWGEKDGWVSESTVKRLHEAIPHSEFQMVPNAGHFVQEDAPEIVASKLTRFFAQT